MARKIVFLANEKEEGNEKEEVQTLLELVRCNGQRQSCPCPVDKGALVYEKDVFPDKATERKILSFAIKCPSEGCEWTGELRGKEVVMQFNHLSSCLYKHVFCTNQNCLVAVLRKDLDEHVGSLCQWRIMLCKYCSEPHPKCQEEEHNKVCKKYHVECPHNCGSTMQREKLQRNQLEFHLDTAARSHLDLACVKLNTNQEEFKETTRKLECKIDALNHKLDSQTQLTASLGTKLVTVDRKLLKLKQELPPFVWRIEGFSVMLKQAKRGKETRIWSDRFLTGAHGYNLMVCIDPNGDADGKNTHVSLYVCICRGLYDSLLPWPFQQQITFTLIDQQENTIHRENYVMKLIPDPEITAVFGRPVTDHNIQSYGWSSFISHRNLRRRRYIVDDTMFLRVQAATGLPQSEERISTEE
ncbi:hypothetical protein ACROYT_G042242 [Oculina patagonica]